MSNLKQTEGIMNIESRWQKVQWKMLKNRHNIECRLKRLIGRKKKPQTRCGKRKRKIPTIPPLLFVCPFRLNSVNILVPSFQHPQQALRYHTGRSLSHLPPHLQAPTPPLRNPLHSLCVHAANLLPVDVNHNPPKSCIRQTR